MTWTAFETAGIGGWHRGDGDLVALVLHGGPGLSDYTEPIADEILAGGDGALWAVRYQQRGHTPSVLDGDYTIDEAVADAVAVLDHFGARRALIAGHSWGGHLAMHFAVRQPGRTAGLLLLDSLGGIGDGGFGTMGPVIESRLSHDARTQLAELFAEGSLSDEARTENLRLRWPGYFKDPAMAPPMPPIAVSGVASDGLFLEAATLLEARYLEERLPAVTGPALHQIGRHSPIEPTANEATAAIMPNAIVDVLDTGHFTWIEQPGSVAAATKRLLDAMDA